MAQQYADGSDAKSAAAVYATADDTLVCCLAGTAVNLRNWWSGGWKGEFTIKLDGTASSAQVTGKCELLIHYFEDGNVQMNTFRDFAEDGVGFGDSAELFAEERQQEDDAKALDLRKRQEAIPGLLNPHVRPDADMDM